MTTCSFLKSAKKKTLDPSITTQQRTLIIEPRHLQLHPFNTWTATDLRTRSIPDTVANDARAFLPSLFSYKYIDTSKVLLTRWSRVTWPAKRMESRSGCGLLLLQERVCPDSWTPSTILSRTASWGGRQRDGVCIVKILSSS